jgi:hypothetical protein
MILIKKLPMMSMNAGKLSSRLVIDQAIIGDVHVCTDLAKFRTLSADAGIT